MYVLAKILIYLINLFFVIVIEVGKLLFVSDQKLISLHIKANNFILKKKWIKINTNKLLILAPHCLQNSECHQNIIIDINNCQGCGKCNLKNLLEVYHQYQISLFIVTGGSIARQKIIEGKYQGIIAIACEKEIEEGIRSSFPLPVFAVINERPHGPCTNTKVDIKKIVEGINCFS
ncbi:MAG: DUF116 domain-containing protein [bacterium]|nr:DUF116 domain-containing protein [bacterium]